VTKHLAKVELGEVPVEHPFQQARAEFDLPLPPSWQIRSGQDSPPQLLRSCHELPSVFLSARGIQRDLQDSLESRVQRILGVVTRRGKSAGLGFHAARRDATARAPASGVKSLL
jgi:hypothetical protein